MTYEEARKFIDQSNQYGIVPGLTSITQLLHRLGDPQNDLKIIHIAGTNGKGSTGTFIASILSAAGYLVGRYVSPAVYSYRERIQIIKNMNDIEYITKDGLAKAIELIQPICESMVQEGFAHPTSFEIETAILLLYLKWKNVDFSIVEAGMGGRLDATNVISHPLCSVITKISLDHMEYLGDTIEQIAAEKAGIIKYRCPVVTYQQSPKVMEVIKGVCEENEADLTVVSPKDIKEIRYFIEGNQFTLVSEENEEDYETGLIGEYQVYNAQLAIGFAKVMENLGYTIGGQAIKNGLRHAKWPGRFEIVSKNPYFVIDGAHNEDAALSLSRSIQLYFEGVRRVFILGVLADKDYRSILKHTAPYADVIITMTPDNKRALASTELAKEAMRYCHKVIDAGTIANAIELAYKEAKDSDVIVAFGSLSFLGDLVKTLGKRKDDI